MKICSLAALIGLSLCSTTALASGTFTVINSPNFQLTNISPNGLYASGPSFSGGLRYYVATGQEEDITSLDYVSYVNDSGTIAGAVPENGGVGNGGRDLGAYLAIGADPFVLTDPLYTNADGYAISADGTVVGLAFEDNFAGAAVAFVWTKAEGMTALPVTYPDNYSRANVISADGSVIAGWNDHDDGSRAAVIWQDRVPLDVMTSDGNAVGEADGISANGRFVVGTGYFDNQGQTGSWIRDAQTGTVTVIPNMGFAFGVSDDGQTVVGANGFFDDPPRAALIWHPDTGTQLLSDVLAEQDIAIPDGWDPTLSGGLGGISADGSLIGGWSYGPTAVQSYLIRFDAGPTDTIFSDGFDPQD